MSNASTAQMRKRLATLDKKVSKFSVEVLTYSERHERDTLRDELEIVADRYRRAVMIGFPGSSIIGASR